jgi:hypothetical protein
MSGRGSVSNRLFGRWFASRDLVRLFGTEDVADSAAHAEELRGVAEDENDAYWAVAPRRGGPGEGEAGGGSAAR